MPTYSRRSVLFGFGAAVGLASLPRHAFAALDGTPFTFLSDTEARSLALLCDTLIPQDDFPSASPAGVVDFTEQADAAFKRFADAGMHVVRSTDAIETWPGIPL